MSMMPRFSAAAFLDSGHRHSGTYYIQSWHHPSKSQQQTSGWNAERRCFNRIERSDGTTSLVICTKRMLIRIFVCTGPPCRIQALGWRPGSRTKTARLGGRGGGVTYSSLVSFLMMLPNFKRCIEQASVANARSRRRTLAYASLRVMP